MCLQAPSERELGKFARRCWPTPRLVPVVQFLHDNTSLRRAILYSFTSVWVRCVVDEPRSVKMSSAPVVIFSSAVSTRRRPPGSIQAIVISAVRLHRTKIDISHEKNCFWYQHSVLCMNRLNVRIHHLFKRLLLVRPPADSWGSYILPLSFFKHRSPNLLTHAVAPRQSVSDCDLG